MSPRYLRYRFPSSHASGQAGLPVESARALAALFLQVPVHELSVGRLDGIACNWSYKNGDPGGLDMAIGDPVGEELAPWLRLVIGPGERLAYLDVDVEEMGRLQASALNEHRKEIRRG